MPLTLASGNYETVLCIAETGLWPNFTVNGYRESSATNQLRKLVRLKGDRFLLLSENDLLTGPWPKELAEYPDALIVAGSILSISYCHNEGDATDGATIMVPLKVFRIVPLTYWQWLLPIFWRSRLEGNTCPIGEKRHFGGRLRQNYGHARTGQGQFHRSDDFDHGKSAWNKNCRKFKSACEIFPTIYGCGFASLTIGEISWIRSGLRPIQPRCRFPIWASGQPFFRNGAANGKRTLY